MERRRGGDGEGGGGRGEGGVTVVTAALALATACLMVQGVVGAATSNPLRASHLLTVDQYAPPSPPYNNHGLLGFYGRRSSNDGSSTEENVNQQQHYHQYQQQQEQQINRKFQDDSHIYRSIDDRHNRRDSLISFSANDLSIGKVYDNDNVGTISRDSAGTIVTQNDKERSKHLSGKNEYDGKKPGGDDYVAPPTEMDEPFVADETFQDEGPGSVEIYKLDLFEGRKSLPSPMSNVKGVIMTGLTGLTLPTPTSIATSATMRIGNNKSKMPKKSSGLSWKVGKSSNGLLKSTTITMVSTGNDNDNDGGATGSGTNNDTKDLHGRSNFLDSELRSEVPSNVEAFGVGGVPELQVGCEGLEAPSSSSSSASSSSATSFSYFSPSSRKLKRSVEKTEKTGEPNGKAEQPTAPFNVVPISLDLDYDISAESYEEMDELFKLKKLESEPKRNKENRGDIDAMVNDFLIQDRNVKERLPVRGDLGNSSLSSVVESIKNVNDLKGSRRKRSSSSSSSSSSSNSSSLSDTNTSGYVSRFNGRSRKLLWVDSESDSGLWGYGENEGLISSDELDTEQRRRQQQQQRQQQDKNIVNVEIDKIREEYDRLLKQQRIVEEERLRRVKELESRRSPTSNSVRDEEDRRKKFYEDRTRMEELRRREEARRREEEYRRRNLITEDRRDLENRRREWMAKRRKEEEEMERRMKLLDEERRRREELEERRRMKDLPIANLQLARYNFNKNESRENEEEERRKLEREYMERNRLLERQRMEDERRRQMLEEERRRREEERRREAMTEERRIERKRMEEERRRGTLEDERRKIEEERRRQEFEKERWRMENEKRKQMSEEENRRRMEMERSRRYRNNVTRDRNDDEEYRRKRIMEERQRRLDEERKLQEYVRRNQPVELRKDERRNEHWNVSQRWREREEEKRKKEEEEKRRQMERAMEAVRQMNRSNRYPPGSGYERREHGPSAPTYIDPRVSLDEARRRQEIEALERRRKEEEEQKRRILEEERRREIEYKREQSRRYEEERKKMETFRLEEDRRTQEMIENQRRRGMTSVRRVGPTATVSSVLPVLGNLMENRRTTEIRQRERLREQQREQQRIREEEEKKRRAIIARQNARRQHENSAKAQWEREDNRRIMNEQYRRHEEARLNALPVSARIIVQPKGSLPHSRPTFTSRAGFENEINFPNVNRRNNGVQTTIFPPYVRSPNPCVWAVVHCCPTNTNRLVTCFESLGCPGVNWDPNPCRGAIADAAREEVMRFYNSQEEDDRN